MSLLIPLMLLVGLVPLVLALVRANELFCIRVRDGRVRVVRGRLPQRLLDDIADVLASEPSARAAIRVVAEDGRPRVYVEGELGADHRQRLRNTVSMWPLPKIRAAPRRR